MFAHIEGIVSEKNRDSMVVDVHGIGFLLYVSTNTLSNSPMAGEPCKLYCVLNVREDAMDLFGFLTREEKNMFERLRSVSGIGSRMALAILSSISVRDLSLALVSGDASTLLRVPGIGKKTAQRLVLELKDKIEDVDLASGGAVPTAGSRPESAQGDAVAALLTLGYSSSEAARAVSAVSDQSEEVDRIVFLALRYLSNAR